MIKNEPFWYISGIIFLISVFDVKRQRQKVEKMRKNGLNYAFEHHIYMSEIGVIAGGILLILNEIFILFTKF